MPMRKRKLILEAAIGGMTMALGEVRIQNFATMYEYTKATHNVCPKCGGDAKWYAPYKCEECDETFTHHSKLRKLVTDTGEDMTKPRLLQPKETAKATIYKMEAVAFAEKYADATMSEAGITADDDTAQTNIIKLVVAVERLGQVIVLRWPDTNEWRVALLTVSSSNRIILREIIPANLLTARETMRVDMSLVTEQGITEAQALLGMIPEATDETFVVNDFRTTGLGTEAAEAPTPTPKVQELSAILAQIQA